MPTKSLQAVLDKADVVLAMDEEMHAQQAQQEQEATPAHAGEGAAPEAAAAASPRPLARSDLECGSGGLPPGIGSSGRMASNVSQEPESPLAAAAGPDAPSVYISAAPSMQLEAADVAADVAATVLLETLPDGSVQLSILLPAEQEGGAEGDGDESEGELPPELAGGWRPGCGTVSGVHAVGLPELRPRRKSRPRAVCVCPISRTFSPSHCRRRGGCGAAYGAPGPPPAGSGRGGAGGLLLAEEWGCAICVQLDQWQGVIGGDGKAEQVRSLGCMVFCSCYCPIESSVEQLDART